MILTRRKIKLWNNLKQNLAQIPNAYQQQQQINSRQWCSVVREDCLVAGTSVVQTVCNRCCCTPLVVS